MVQNCRRIFVDAAPNVRGVLAEAGADIIGVSATLEPEGGDVTQALRDDPARFKAILERIPAGRWGEIEDFAGPVVFLASSAADYVHGTVLTVDGGWMGR